VAETSNLTAVLGEGSEDRLASALLFLSAASKVLSSTLEVARALRRVGEIVVPVLADGFAVAFEDGGARSIVAAAGRVPPFGCAAASRVLDCELTVRGQVFGTLRVARAAAPFDELDRLLFGELALRAAVAIDSARISAREHRADTLKRALLPERLPATGQYRFDAAYWPGTEEAIVGGDWYDAFVLPDGRLAFSIGDVAGHGLAAAIVMGEVRQAVRAAALSSSLPSSVLERANAIVNMRVDPVMVTAIFGLLDPATSTVTYATAGHLPPLLAAPGGTTERLPTGGIPLGIAGAVDAVDWTFTIAPGSMLALYTDGLIEGERDVLAGEERLRAAVSIEAAARRPSPARALLERVFATTKNTDDAAALVVTVEDVAARDFYFEFSAIPFAVPMARHALRRYAERLELDAERTFALVGAVGEAMANAVEHAYNGEIGNVRVRVAHAGDALHATIEDFGRWKPAHKRDERGRGLPLMRALVDGVEIRTNQVCTTIALRLSLEAAASR
jgi:serine phosphatase RsbU (regulator of sigma subunit)/anti-sigma regulatory factor (Ser/Thr protein kinase)